MQVRWIVRGKQHRPEGSDSLVTVHSHFKCLNDPMYGDVRIMQGLDGDIAEALPEP